MTALAVGAVGCGSDGDGAEGSGEEETTTTSSGEFCEAAETYRHLLDDVDVSSVEVLLQALADSAVAAREMADLSPAELTEGTEALASAAESLATSIAAEAPTTMEEFETAADAAVADLDEEFGERLDEEVAQVEDYATETCGIEPG